MAISILHLIFSLLSTAVIAHVMLGEKQFDPTPQMLDFLDAQHVLGAWIFPICAALFLRAGGAAPQLARRVAMNTERRNALSETAR